MTSLYHVHMIHIMGFRRPFCTNYSVSSTMYLTPSVHSIPSVGWDDLFAQSALSPALCNSSSSVNSIHIYSSLIHFLVVILS